MITTQNYHDKIKGVDFSNMPEAIRKGHEFVKKTTDNGAHWDNYHASETIQRMVDTYFKTLEKFLNERGKAASSGKNKKPQATKPAEKAKHKEIKATKPVSTATNVERISEEARFIRRFVNLNGKPKSNEDILRFINGLQKAILEKRIRKSSKHVEQIRFIQDTLIGAYNESGKSVTIELEPKTLEALRKIAGGEKVMSSVSFIKRYINLNGKAGIKEKAKLLFGQINRAFEQGTVSERDPYAAELSEIQKNLENYLAERSVKVLQIEKNTLNGLQGIINGCSCQNLNGFDGDEDYTETAKPTVMNSMDFANMHFDTLGFSGKWLQLIGDPSTNFSLMVYGKPKMGKSYLCMDFAGYLARNHGKVLYVAKEEGLDKTLQDKLNEKEVKHPNLTVASTLIPGSLAFYDFIFLDSVNRLGLTPEDLNKLRAAYPKKSFVFVFQTTKDGKFRGANTFQHDVDSVIEIPERGKAVQYGRFNAGGEMPIF